MSSPYASPQAEDLLVLPQAAGKGIRWTTRVLGLGSILAAIGLAHFAGNLSSAAREFGFFDAYPYRILVLLFLQHGGAWPLLVTLLFASTGLILSFRSRSRTLPMLVFGIA